MGSWYSIGEFLDDLFNLADTFECDIDANEVEKLVEKFKYYYFNIS